MILEKIKIVAFYTFKEILKSKDMLKNVSLRTAAYAIALNKLKEYHKDMGVSNYH